MIFSNFKLIATPILTRRWLRPSIFPFRSTFSSASLSFSIPKEMNLDGKVMKFVPTPGLNEDSFRLSRRFDLFSLEDLKKRKVSRVLQMWNLQEGGRQSTTSRQKRKGWNYARWNCYLEGGCHENGKIPQGPRCSLCRLADPSILFNQQRISTYLCSTIRDASRLGSYTPRTRCAHGSYCTIEKPPYPGFLMRWAVSFPLLPI